MANHLESGGLAGRVHVSKATANYLNNAYQLEPADGHLRDGYIRQANVETFFIKQTEPSSHGKPQRLADTQAVASPATAKNHLDTACLSPDTIRLPSPLTSLNECKASGNKLATPSQLKPFDGGVVADATASNHPSSAVETSYCNMVEPPQVDKSAVAPKQWPATNPTDLPEVGDANNGVGSSPGAVSPTTTCISMGRNVSFGDEHDDDDDAEVDEEDAEEWKPEIPFMNLDASRRPGGESISSLLLQSSGADGGANDATGATGELKSCPTNSVEGGSAEDINGANNNIGANQASPDDGTAKVISINSNNNKNRQQAARSMGSLLRASFRHKPRGQQQQPQRSHHGSSTPAGDQGLASSNNVVVKSGEHNQPPDHIIQRHENRGQAEGRQLQFTTSTPEAKAPASGEAPSLSTNSTSQVSLVLEGESPDRYRQEMSKGRMSTKGPTSRGLDALRRSYYRSFNIKSSSDARLETDGHAEVNSATVGSTPRNQVGSSSGSSIPISALPLCNSGEMDTTNTSGISQAAAVDAADRQGSSSVAVCIKIIDKDRELAEADGDSLKSKFTTHRGSDFRVQMEPIPGSLQAADAGGDSSVIVSCPTNGDGIIHTTTSRSNILSSKQRMGQHLHFATTTTTMPSQTQPGQRRSPANYLILFSRLFYNQLRRTGCWCGLGRLRHSAASGVVQEIDRVGRKGGPRRRKRRRSNKRSSNGAVENKQLTGSEANRKSSGSSLGDTSIEVEISRRMMEENLNWFSLTFKSKALEKAYCQIRVTTSKSNIVYIFITWLLMALVFTLSLPDTWETLEVLLWATIPLLVFACFYMSDSILYSQYMNYKLKEALIQRRHSSSGARKGGSLRSKPSFTAESEPLKKKMETELETDTKMEEQTQTRVTSSIASSWSFTSSSNQLKVAPLVHRVAKFWSKLDRIPMIWNIFIFLFNFIMTVAFLNLNFFHCHLKQITGTPRITLFPTKQNISSPSKLPADVEGHKELLCLHEENLMFSIILIMLGMGSFFRANYLKKVTLLIIMAAGFIVFFYCVVRSRANSAFLPHAVNETVTWNVMNIALDNSVCPMITFNVQEVWKTSMSDLLRNNLLAPFSVMYMSQCDPLLTEKSIVIIVIILFGLIYVCRSTERISRLDFMWKLQASKELQDMRALRHYNTQLLENILPDHVAAYFLQDERDSEELYAKSYACVAVLFASIPNFSSFYSEDINNGMECIRLLNEIIFDFDQLLEDEQFRSIEKVKTISSTYMAACGLNPRDQSLPPSYHLSVCCKFAFAMKRALNEVNVHSFNNFVMRVGISHGPLVGGVIGAKKPVFDIWGDTVNEASRMDSTGTLDMIQVPKRSADILANEGFSVKLRGVIQVKGKGEMETYYVTEECTAATKQQVAAVDSQRSGQAKLVAFPQNPSETGPAKKREPQKVDRFATDIRGLSNSEKDISGSEPASAKRSAIKLTRHSRTAQSLRDTSRSARDAMRSRSSKRHFELELHDREAAIDSHLGRLTPGLRRTSPGNYSPVGVARAFGSCRRGVFASRQRSDSPLSGSMMVAGSGSEDSPKSPSQFANNPEASSLTSVVYNMVQMRKHYDALRNRISSAPGASGVGTGGGSGGSHLQTAGGSTGQSSQAAGGGEQHHHTRDCTTGGKNDLSDEAAKFVSESTHDPFQVTLQTKHHPVRLNHASMILRPRSLQAGGQLAGSKSPRTRASLFSRRGNYRRTAGASPATEYGPTEESINEDE